VALQILLNDTYKLNHCKEMGAKLGRRFLKQPAEKLKAVFVATNHFTVNFEKKAFEKGCINSTIAQLVCLQSASHGKASCLSIRFCYKANVIHEHD